MDIHVCQFTATEKLSYSCSRSCSPLSCRFAFSRVLLSRFRLRFSPTSSSLPSWACGFWPFYFWTTPEKKGRKWLKPTLFHWCDWSYCLMFIPRAVNDANLICDLHLMGTTLGLNNNIRGLTCNMNAYRQNIQKGVLPICAIPALTSFKRRLIIRGGPSLETLDVVFRIYIGSTPTFLYFDLYFNTAYAAPLRLLQVENVLIPSC